MMREDIKHRDLSNQVYRQRLYKNDGLPELTSLVNPLHHRIIDVGCGDGANMRLLSKHGHDVEGLTLSQAEAKVCRSQGFKCTVCDVTSGLPFPDASFDAILLSHVLEHFAYPEVVLKSILRILRSNGGVYIALPNILVFNQRFQFLRGKFRYTESGGLMDFIHLRFFDFASARQLLEGAGIQIDNHFAVGHFPVGFPRRFAPSLFRHLDKIATRKWPGFFGTHIILSGTLKEG